MLRSHQGQLDAMAKEIAGLRDNVHALQESRNHLKKEVIRLRADIEKLRLQFDTTTHFFEYRVDQIYENILRHMRLPGELCDAGSDTLAVSPNPDWEKLIEAARNPVLEPRHIPSPLTLSGFRVDTRCAVERLEFIEITAARQGIAVYGPYKKLVPGRYTVDFVIEPMCPGEPLDLFVECFTAFGGKEHRLASSTFDAAVGKMMLEIDWPFESLNADLEFRIHQRGNTAAKLFAVTLKAE
jgi:hypothetical protein